MINKLINIRWLAALSYGLSALLGAGPIWLTLRDGPPTTLVSCMVLFAFILGAYFYGRFKVHSVILELGKLTLWTLLLPALTMAFTMLALFLVYHLPLPLHLVWFEQLIKRPQLILHAFFLFSPWILGGTLMGSLLLFWLANLEKQETAPG